MSVVEKKFTVLVTEGENRASLAVTRSLGRYGCNVIVTGERQKIWPPVPAIARPDI
jgi:hypothetical protein